MAVALVVSVFYSLPAVAPGVDVVSSQKSLREALGTKAPGREARRQQGSPEPCDRHHCRRGLALVELVNLEQGHIKMLRWFP